MKTIVTFVFYFFCIVLSYGQQQKVTNPEFDTMLKKLLSHTVNEIPVTDTLDYSDAIFLDAREKNEYDVSHIKNAQWIGFNNFDSSKLHHLPKDKKIIVYCSVGYRSEKITEKLKKLGFENSFNLYGGIFEWANKNKELYNTYPEQKTDSVHTYDKEWSQWLTNPKKITVY